MNMLVWAADKTGTKDQLRQVRDKAMSASDNVRTIRRMRARSLAEDILNVLIDPADCVDRFDASYLDDLEQIFEENHSITESNFRDWYFYPKFKFIADYYRQTDSELRLSELSSFLQDEIGVDPADYSPAIASSSIKKRLSIHRASSWGRAQNVRNANGDSGELDVINQFQIDISLYSGGESQVDPAEFYLRTTTDGKEPWSDFIRGLLGSGKLTKDSEVLDIGPRYTSEIMYFRNGLGLEKTIGLDLFTVDGELVKVGDMHEMPFDDSSFDLIYTRNTYDKSYDIRKLVAETIRIAKPGGVVIVEDTMNYIYGVTELARTNVKSVSQLIRLFGSSVGEVLYNKDVPSNTTFCRTTGQMAIEIKKPPLSN